MRGPAEVFLTFDDGPSQRLTDRVLNTLTKHNVTAFFFVLGNKAGDPYSHSLVREMLFRGHIVGNHGYSHADWTQLRRQDTLAEIRGTDEILARFGIENSLIRPPFGRVDENVAELLLTLQRPILAWNLDPRDWSPEHQPCGWVDLVVRQVANTPRRHVVLLHDIHPTTASGLGKLIVRLRDWGVVFPGPQDLYNPQKPIAGRSTGPFPGWQQANDVPLFFPVSQREKAFDCETALSSSDDMLGQ